MKKMMMFSIALFMLLSMNSCNAQGSKNAENQTTLSSKVEVYYFHYTRRCKTCMAVEENSRKAVEALFPDKIKSGEYTFQGINLDDESSKTLADKLSIGGQTLLVVYKDKKIDLTDQGFMNAHNLEKMKEIITKAIEEITKS